MSDIKTSTPEEVAEWNRLHQPGDKCALKLDDGSYAWTTLRTPAWLASGFALASVEGKAGGWLLERICFPYYAVAAMRFMHMKHPFEAHPLGYITFVAPDMRRAVVMANKFVGYRNYEDLRTKLPTRDCCPRGEIKVVYSMEHPGTPWNDYGPRPWKLGTFKKPHKRRCQTSTNSTAASESKGSSTESSPPASTPCA